MASNNMAPPSLFKTPEEVAAQSSMNNNDSAAQHVSHLPPTIDPSTASMTATKPTALLNNDTYSHSGVLPPVGAPPALKTPNTISQEPSDQWAAQALDAIAPASQGQFAHLQQPSAASTPGLDMPGSFPRSYVDSNAPDVDLQYVKQVATDVATTVVEVARNVAAAAVPVVQNAAGYVQENAPAAAATTRDMAGNAAGAVANTTSNVAATVGPAASNAAGVVGNTASNAAGVVGNTASNAAGVVGSTASNAAGAVGSTASNAAGTVGTTVQPVTSSVASTAGNVGSTVREYAATAGDALKPYVPAAVAGILPSHASTPTGLDSLTGDGVARLPEETRTKGFPSNDDEGFTPLGKTGGVGPLPGTARESGVAVLPDERNAKDEIHQDHSTRVAPFHKEIAPKDGVSNTANLPILPVLGHDSAAPSGLPTRDTPEVSTHAPVTSVDHSTGASANASIKTLPGSKKTSHDNFKVDSGIAGIGAHDPANHHPRTHMGATLAEINTQRSELGHPLADNRAPAVPSKERFDSDLATTGHGAPVSTTTNTLPHAEPPVATGVNAIHSTTDHAGRESAGERTKDTTLGITSGAGAAATAPGLSMGHTAGVHAETHPTYGKDDGAKASALGDHSRDHTTSSNLSSGSTDSTGEKKPGFMSKLKGEVKVISGKLGHNEAKIEEGKRLLGKN